MNQSEFIKEYCGRSGLTEERLNSLGQFAVACDCNVPDCKGWAMVSRGTVHDHVQLYITPSKNGASNK